MEIWLFLHDSTGIHDNQHLCVHNDINADSTPPEAHIEIVEDSSFTDFVEFVGYQQTPTGKQDENGNWIMVDSPKYRVRLSDTGDTSIRFSSANSSDIGTGIGKFTWSVNGDGDNVQSYELPGSQVEWTYTFRNLTAGENTIMVELTVYDKRDQRNEEPTRVFFEVVGEMFGDAAPEVQFDSIATADGESFNGLESDIINITGTVVDNDASADCDVKVEASLDDLSIFDKSDGIKTAQKALGRFDWQEGLCDGDQYFLTLNISHKYLETEGNVGVIHIRLTEGAYVVDDQITLYTVPRSNEEQGGNEEGSGTLPLCCSLGIGHYC
ncbi:MAG: hypothetical protein CM15mP6_4480 [Methanobacteriota archaeon]|nr:MAG: hypothetical protein CM15mP6_4480 [Euryarchaeota archaeon]